METKCGTTLHCYHTPSWPTLVIDQDPERKSTTRMKKPTQRLEELDFNHYCRHLGSITLVCCFCLRGLGFVRKISLFFVFMGFWIWSFWVWSFSVFCLRGFLYLIFLCFFVSWFFACLLVYVCVFQVLIYGFSIDSSSQWIFIEIKSVILALLQWTRISMTLDVSFLNNLETMLTNKIV